MSVLNPVSILAIGEMDTRPTARVRLYKQYFYESIPAMCYTRKKKWKAYFSSNNSGFSR